MLKEVLEFLDIKPNHWYIDCNLGGGGHTKTILEKGGNVIGIDLDPDAISEVSKNLKEYIDSNRLILTQNNFINLKEILNSSFMIHNSITGILFDLGVSSFQLETGERGFSFNKDAPLDMRMDQNSNTATAKDLINGLHEGELSELFWKLGEENFSKPIAKKIVEYRKNKQIETTNELANLILSVRRRTPSDRTHPATRVFQALRIAVNDELNTLREALPQAFEVLEPGGHLVVISFHSLEDRIVKNFFNSLVSHSGAKQSGAIESLAKANILTKKPIEPTEEEILKNPRSRSGKLRAIEKLQTVVNL